MWLSSYVIKINCMPWHQVFWHTRKSIGNGMVDELTLNKTLSRKEAGLSTFIKRGTVEPITTQRPASRANPVTASAKCLHTAPRTAPPGSKFYFLHYKKAQLWHNLHYQQQTHPKISNPPLEVPFQYALGRLRHIVTARWLCPRVNKMTVRPMEPPWASRMS